MVGITPVPPSTELVFWLKTRECRFGNSFFYDASFRPLEVEVKAGMISICGLGLNYWIKQCTGFYHLL